MTAHGLGFGLFFFGAHEEPDAAVYRAMRDLVTAADSAGLRFVSVPERHFHPFGGAFPSPSVLSAAFAAVTEQIELRAGSVISPLHDIARVVEEWAVVDNLSNGRAAISLGSGWSANDFVLAPERDAFARRRDLVQEHVAEIRRLWGGGVLERENAIGETVSLRLYPRPRRASIPLWLTAGGSEETFAAAGRLGTNVLTHLERQSLDVLSERIAVYRSERERAGHDPETGVVTVMQHTLVGDRDDETLEVGRRHLDRYIRASLDLEARTVAGGGKTSGGSPVMPFSKAGGDDQDAVVDRAVSRYLDGASLVGSVDRCFERALELHEAGVTEIACLVDFVADPAVMSSGLRGLVELAGRLSPTALQLQKAALAEDFTRDDE